MVAGHSLGEFSALIANRVLSFEDGLKLVARRAEAMQRACDKNPSTMAAVIGMEDAAVEAICQEFKADGVVAANYNSPGQVIISGSIDGINKAAERFKAAGARQVLVLRVGGAFHSPFMEPARDELEQAIANTNFNNPTCPVYQNVDAHPYIDPALIKQNLMNQLTSPVRWAQTMQKMIDNGATQFTEVGPGRVLQGLLKKIAKEMPADGIS
jgi:[acyl-carrier-protein] S-malonyltransferase